MKDKEFQDALTEIYAITDPRVINYYKEHQDLVGEIRYLTEWKLKEDLEEAVKYKHGYFKNKKGEYRFLKGIEVTNDVSNLCRMGYNGEDHGVWVHYCEVNNKRVIYNDVPVGVFTYWLNPNCVDAESLFEPTTKEDFDEQVKKTVQNIISDYQEKRDAKEYLDFLKGWDDIYEQAKKEYAEDEEMRKVGEQRLLKVDDNDDGRGQQ